MVLKLEYGVKKDLLIRYLEEIKTLSEDLSKDINDDVDYEIQKLAQNQFNIAVVGQFKRGKSTFINAMLKDRIVPMAIIPLTSIVTIIKYGKQFKITVVFNDETQKEIPHHMLEEYATERGNPKNEKGVKHISIEYPSDFLKKGITLIDTPGVGSVFQHNTDITYNFLPKLDAAIFLFTIDSPVAQSELDFLKDVSKRAVKIFFLLNKTDYAEKNDIKEALDFTKRILLENLETPDIKIYSISAKIALEAGLENHKSKWENSGFPEFIADLEEFISSEKGNALLTSVCKSALGLISQLKFTAELELKAVTTPLDELNEKISRLKEEFQKIEEEERDILHVFDGETKEILGKLQYDYENFKTNNYKILETDLEQQFKENINLPTKEFIENTRNYITDETLNLIDSWRKKELKELAEASEKITGKLSQKIESIISELQHLTADIFDIKFEGFLRIKGFKQAGYFYYNMEPEKSFLMPNPLSVARFLPQSMAKKVVKNHLRQWLQQQFDRQCGRVRYDISQRMNLTFNNYADYLKNIIRETKENILKSLEKAAEIMKHGESSTEEKVKKLKNIIMEIKKLEKNINQIMLQI
jgi:GTPase Era involved in 16S rRNA processing